MNKETLALVKSSGLPYFVVSEDQQIGNNFGERLSNAFFQIYSEGYTNVIAIGNDSPQLKKTHLLEAANQLKNTAAVVGPNEDGGFYLIGLQRNAFEKEQFTKLPWQSPTLAIATQNLLAQNSTSYYTLSTLIDIDNAQDLYHLVHHIKDVSQFVAAFIHAYITKPLLSTTLYLKDPGTAIIQNFFNKGSPLVISM